MNQFKLRQISGNFEQGTVALGITIPVQIAEKYLGTYFHIFDDKNGNILLVSGSKIEVNNHDPQNKNWLAIRQSVH